MTEIQFLLDVLMNDKPNTKLKEKLLARIGEVENRLTSYQPSFKSVPIQNPNAAIEPQPVVTNSPAVQAALAARAQALATGEAPTSLRPKSHVK